MNKILASKFKHNGIEALSEVGLLHYILPEVNACKNIPQPYQFHQEGDVYNHILLALKYLPAKTPLYIVWAVLLHDIGKAVTFSSQSDRIHFNGHAVTSIKLAEEILRRLAFSNSEKFKILWLIENHMLLSVIPKMKRVKQHDILSHELFPALLKVFKADISGSKPRDYKLYKQVKKMHKDEKVLLLAQPQKLLTGKDIMEYFEIPASAQVGKFLELLREGQLKGEVKNKKEAFAFLKRFIKTDN